MNRKIHRNLIHASLLVCTSGAVLAVQLECHQDPRTDSMMCIDPKAVTEVGGIRSAKLYKGGPKEIDATNFFVATNCLRGVTHLKDRQGVSFGGGSGNETPAIAQLRSIICTASIKKKR